MKLGVTMLLSNIATICCIVGAIYLMDEGKDGWGWLIFSALALHCTIKNGE